MQSNQNQRALLIYRRLLTALWPHIGTFSIGIIGTILGSLTDAGLMWLIEPIINKGFVAKEAAFIRWLPIGIMAIFIIKGITDFVSSYYVSRVGRRIVTEFRQKIFSHFLKLPAVFFDSYSSGQLLALIIYNVDQIAEATTTALLTLIQEGFLVIGLITVMLIMSWKLTLMILVITPAIILIARYTSTRLRKVSAHVQESMGDLTHIAEEAIEGYKVIRLFGGETYESQKFKKATELTRHRELKVEVANSLGTSAIQFVAAVPIAVILYFATLPSLHVSAGGFAAIAASMLNLLRPLRRLTRVNSAIQKGIAGAESIFNLLDEPSEKDEGVIPIQRAIGNIECKDIVFFYPKRSNAVLNHINLSVKSGETVALVGKSGSGKTTLVNLLPRFYDVSSGSILIDGVDIRHYRLSELRHQFAFVSQNISLFNDTIARNIAYGHFEKASDEDIIRVARMSHAYEFIQHLPQEFNTLIGENGVLLSGGQRQRIAIARALLKDAPILILDEATSALDTVSERHIQLALETLMQNRTTIVIAHRLSTVEKADRIFVMEQGRIVEVGTHQELLEKEGYYKKLYAMQFSDNKQHSEDWVTA